MKRNLVFATLFLASVFGDRPLAGSDIPFSGSFKTIGYNTADLTTVFVAGTGTATQLGQASTLLQGRLYDFTQPGPTTPPGAKYDSTFLEFASANGDALFMKFTGATVTFTSQTSLVFAGTLIATGGTGPFAGATGSAPFSGSFQFTGPQNGVGNISFQGTLSTPAALPALTLPALVESVTYQTEVVAENHGTDMATLSVQYTESLAPSGGGGAVSIDLMPGEQKRIPNFIDYMRTHGATLGPNGSATFAGAARVRVSGTAASNIVLGARVAASAARGSYGAYLPAIAAGDEAAAGATLYGLRDDATARTNVAVLCTGPDEAGPITLRLQVYDAEAGGAPGGSPEVIALVPGRWWQLNKILATKGVRRGWVRVTREAGTAPWATYAIENDGSYPGAGTDDASAITMVKQ